MTPTQLMFDLDPEVGTVPGPAPIAFRVKESARSRRVYLRVVPGHGLVVTVPKRFPRHDLAALVESRRAWVMKALAELDAKTPPAYRQWPPTQLTLAMLEQRLAIMHCKPGVEEQASWHWNEAGSLVLRVEGMQREALASCVADALKQLARQHLPDRLAELASVHHLHYKKVVIRGQRSVWGSYSSSGTLSLNYKLLFLPAALSDYVLLHELAHTRHLNHSAHFWRLLESFAPGARELDAQLADAGALVPPWLELAN